MSAARRRRKAAERAARVHRLRPMRECTNCGLLTSDGHFAVPSLGEPGFWICTPHTGLSALRTLLPRENEAFQRRLSDRVQEDQHILTRLAR